MKVLFDQGVPVPLRNHIPNAKVSTCYEMGWSTLSNGELINQAETEFDCFVTTDKNLRYQQDLVDRKVTIFVLPTTRWPLLEEHSGAIGKAVIAARSGSYVEWTFPV